MLKFLQASLLDPVLEVATLLWKMRKLHTATKSWAENLLYYHKREHVIK